MSRTITLKLRKPEFLRFFGALNSFQKMDKNLKYEFPDIHETPGLIHALAGFTFNSNSQQDKQNVVNADQKVCRSVQSKRKDISELSEFAFQETDIVFEEPNKEIRKALPEVESFLNVKELFNSFMKEKVEAETIKRKQN